MQEGLLDTFPEPRPEFESVDLSSFRNSGRALPVGGLPVGHVPI